MSVDAQVLRKRLGRTSCEAARALLDSLLLYVLDHANRPPRAKDRDHKVSHPAQPQEVSRRPTCFQLLQAKFMGRGREAPLKRTREVGRLISKDRQGPGRSFVNTTISKLLEKAQGGTGSPSQRPAAQEKPRWGGPGGKNTVKNILKKFLAAEEKEAKERNTCERHPSQRPGVARGPLPRVAGRSTILSKLREKFEQSSCLHAEAKVLPLHKEDRKSRALQRRTHRPEVRMLHMATMATSCTRTPPARFLACTAERLPPLSIATVVGSPHSWLSRCTKISHLDARRQARTEASLSPSMGQTEPERNEIPGTGPLSVDPRGQWKPSEFSVPQAMAPGNPHTALSVAGSTQPDFFSASDKDRARPSHLPAMAVLSPASPRNARSAGGDRMVEPTAVGAADHIRGMEEGTEEVPQVIMTLCSSEDEAESALPASEREPLFATQRWLPEPQQEAEPCIPPAPPGVQAARRTQPSMESPQITMQLPIVLEMPASPSPQPSALSHKARSHQVSRGEAATERVAPGPVAGDRWDAPAPAGLSRTDQVPESTPSSELGRQGALRYAAGMGHNALQTVLTPKPPNSPAGKGKPCGHPGLSGPTISVYSCDTHPLPELSETWTPSHPPAWKSCPAGSSHPAPAPAPARPAGPGPQERDSLLAGSQDCRQPESSTSMDQIIPCGQEKHPGLPTEPALPLGMALGNPSHDLGKKGQPLIDDRPKTVIPAFRETTDAGNVEDPTVPWAGARRTPRVDTQTAPQSLGTQTVPQAGAQKVPRADAQTVLGVDTQTAPWAGIQAVPQTSAQTGPLVRPQKTPQVNTQTAPQAGAQKVPRADAQTALGVDTQTAPWAGIQAVPQTGAQTGPLVHPQKTPQVNTQTAPQAGAHTLPRADTQKALFTDSQTVPQAGAQALENKPEMAALDEEGSKAPSARPCTTAGEGLPHEPAPSRPSMHKIEATEGGVLDSAQHRAPTWAPSTTYPGDVADPCPAFAAPRLCAPGSSRASKPSAPSGDRDIHAMEGDALCNSVMSQTPTARHPERSLGCGLGKPRWPSADAQAKDRSGLQADPQPLPGMVPPSAHPTGLALVEEAAPAQRALELPGQQAEPRAVPKVKSSGPTPAGMGPPENHHGSMNSKQTGQRDCPQTMALPLRQEARRCEPESWAALDLAGSEKPAAKEKPGTGRAQDQEHSPGPRVRPVGSPAQGDSMQAAGGPAAHGQAQARGTAPQARGQPGSLAKGAAAASTSGKPSGPAPSVGSQGSQGAGCPAQRNKHTGVCPEPVGGLAPLAPDVGSHQAPEAPAQVGLPDILGAEQDRSDREQRRRLVRFAKYKAQSFSDQRAFDLFFRPVVLRASDTFEAPK